MKKLNLKKKVITVLTDQEKMGVNGGQVAAGTTSYSQCTGLFCCGQQPCIKASEGYSPGCATNPSPTNATWTCRPGGGGGYIVGGTETGTCPFPTAD